MEVHRGVRDLIVGVHFCLDWKSLSVPVRVCFAVWFKELTTTSLEIVEEGRRRHVQNMRSMARRIVVSFIEVMEQRRGLPLLVVWVDVV